MATTVTKTIINEGPSKVIVSFLIESDGLTGELVNELVLDPAVDLDPNLTNLATNQMTIMQVWASLAWFDVLLRFNAASPVTAWTLTRDGLQYHDFRYFGGLKDRANQNHDGKLLFSTNGLDSIAASTGTLVIEFKKN